MTWKLPEHLEPYRECILVGKYNSIEDAMNITDLNDLVFKKDTLIQICILQRLYDANLLKEPPEKFTDDEVRAMFTKNTIITDEK